MTAASLWWAFTLFASGAQTVRNVMQRDLIGALGAVGAAQVRFLFGVPFAFVFLAGMLIATGEPLPAVPGPVFVWALIGAISQIVATSLMLAAMRERSFVVVTAAMKTEAAQVALFSLAFLAEKPTPILLGAIGLATLGVWLLSGQGAAAARRSPRGLLLGLVSAAFFAVAAIGFRLSIRAVPTPSFLVAASTVLCLGLAMQTALCFVYLGLFDRARIGAILAAWRPSLFAGFIGALSSQVWFIAFALTDAARVRTLALVEVLFAQAVSLRLFRERPSGQELLGIALIVAAAAVLVSGAG